MTLSPDSQPRDAYGWATNQSAHVMIGFGLALVVVTELALRNFIADYIATNLVVTMPLTSISFASIPRV